jgi:hypothetical protein
VLYNDPVDLISQEDKVNECNSSLKMPFGVRDDRVAPLLTRVHVDTMLEAWVAVVEAGHGGGKVIDKWQQDGSNLETIFDLYVYVLIFFYCSFF